MTINRDEQIDLVYDALMDLGRIECDCNRVVDPSRSISREDVVAWLDKRHIKEVKEIAGKYIPVFEAGTSDFPQYGCLPR